MLQYCILLTILCGTTAQEMKNVSTLEPNNLIPATEATEFTYEEAEALTKDKGLKDAPDVTGGKINITGEANDVLPTTVALEDTNGTLATIETTTTPAPKVPCSNDTEWTCQDFGCIANRSVCDGVIDCEDASDEYRETCKERGESKNRQLFALILHCSSFWTDFHKKVCPEICSKEPEFCYYALNAERGEERTCKFPEFPEHGWYNVKPNTTSNVDLPAFRLKYNCFEPYVVVEHANLECINGSWENLNATRYCSEACPVVKRDKFTYTCPIDRDTDSNLCGKYVAIGTTVTVSRFLSKQEGDKQTNDIFVQIQCKDNKEFNMTTDCVQEIDDLQSNFEKPTMETMTYYETSFNHIKSNDTKHDSKFNSLVNDFHTFEADVKANLSMMHRKAEECDIVLDLMLLDLEDKQKAKDNEASTPNPVSSTTIL